MLFCSFDADEVRDEATREQLLDMTDLALHFNSKEMPQFIAYGTKDGMVGMDETLRYIRAAQNAGASLEVVVAEGQDHGFKQIFYMDAFIDWLDEIFE